MKQATNEVVLGFNIWISDGIKERTVYKKLRDYVKNGLLKKLETGVYSK